MEVNDAASEPAVDSVAHLDVPQVKEETTNDKDLKHDVVDKELGTNVHELDQCDIAEDEILSKLYPGLLALQGRMLSHKKGGLELRFMLTQYFYMLLPPYCSIVVVVSLLLNALFRQPVITFA